MAGRDITILGGGIAGLTAAIALTRRGARVTVLEQAEAIRELGAGLQISPNGVAVLRALGLGDDLARIGLHAAAVSLRDYAAGREVLRLDLSRAAGPYYFVHRADLVEMLADAARAAGVKLRLLQQIKSVRVGARGASLTTAQGAVINARLLIGADGLHSVVREALNGASRPFFTGQVAWRALVPAAGEVAPEARIYMGPGRHLVCYPLRGGQLINLVAVQEREAWAEEGWHHRDDPANLRAAFADFGAEVQALLARVEEVYLWGLFRHPVAPVWHRGAAAIVGDAAHPTLPFMAQGANMALEDAWVLAAVLDAGDSVEAALAAYQTARRDRCTRIVDAASRNARNYHLSFPPLRAAAHAMLRLGGRLAPERMLHRFDWLYAHDVTRADP